MPRATSGSLWGKGFPASTRAESVRMSDVGSTPGGAKKPEVSPAANNPAMVLWMGTPNGSVWLPSGGASAHPSVPRPFGASTWIRSENVYMGTAAAQLNGVLPFGVVHGASEPSALPVHGSGPSAAG